MLKLLIRKQLTEIFRMYFYNAKKNTRRSKWGTIGFFALFALLLVGLIGGIFTFLSVVLCNPFVSAGVDWLYFAMMALIAIFMGAFGSVFNTYSGLYLAKDNDLLLSLPIPIRTIVASRLSSVYLMGVMYSSIVIVPAIVVYWCVVPVSVPAVIGSVLTALLVSIIVLILSCVLGCVVAKLSQKLRHKSILVVLASLVFIAAYYFVYFKAQQIVMDLISNAAVYGEKIRGAAYPVYLFGRMGQGDWFAIAVVTAAVAALLALTWLLLSRSFLGLATSGGNNHAAAKRARGDAKVKSVSAALLAKELGRFSSSPNYILNCGLGTVFLLVCSVLLVIKGSALMDMLGAVWSDTGMIAVLLSCVVCLIASMNTITAPSISLEAKNLWLAQALPIRPWQTLRAKALVQILISTIPAFLCAACAAIAVRPDAATAVLMALLPLLFTVLAAFFGLFMNLKSPNLTWTSEIVVIKQSMAVMVTLFSGWIYVAILLAGGFLLNGKISSAMYLAICSGVTGALAALAYRWVKTRGADIFASL